MADNRSSFRPIHLALSAFLLSIAAPQMAVAGSQDLAGQVCPQGSFVIGFDSNGNILCSDVCGNGYLNTDEACDDGNTEDGDGCSSTCEIETVAKSEVPTKVPEEPAAAAVAAGSAAPAAEAAEPAAPAIAAGESTPVAAVLTIADVEPSGVVYGMPELKVTITGEGFTDESIVILEGKKYEASVNAAGTQLQTTLVTRQLVIGRYAIKVVNGPETQAVMKKALVVY